MVDDTTVCTHINNVKKTAVRIIELEEEKYRAVGIAAEAEVNNDLKDKEIERLQKEVKRYDRRIAVQKFYKPVVETTKGIIFLVTGIVIGRL